MNPPDYKVGYGHPPIHTRFQPGESGNPKGRSRGSRNLKTTVLEILEERIDIREGDRIRRMPSFEAILRVTRQRALKGDAKAFALIWASRSRLATGLTSLVSARKARKARTTRRSSRNFCPG